MHSIHMLYWCMNYLPSLQLFEHLHLLLATPSDVSSRTSTCKCADSNNPPKSRPTKAPSSIFGTKAPWFSQLTKVKFWESESSIFFEIIYIHIIWFLSFNVIYLAHILPVPWKKWRIDTNKMYSKWIAASNITRVTMTELYPFNWLCTDTDPVTLQKSDRSKEPIGIVKPATPMASGRYTHLFANWPGVFWCPGLDMIFASKFSPLTIRNATYVNLII